MKYRICVLFIMLAGCVSGVHERPDYYTDNGSNNDPKPFCKSGPGGQTAQCASAVIETAVLRNAVK